VSRNQRLALVAGAVVAVVVAFVIIKPGGGSSSSDEPVSAMITLRNHVPVGGARRIIAHKGKPVHITVASNASDVIHVHGYNLERRTSPGHPARFDFTARIAGVFDIETHATDKQIGSLAVEP
jgi:hypothetical protein